MAGILSLLILAFYGLPWVMPLPPALAPALAEPPFAPPGSAPAPSASEAATSAATAAQVPPFAEIPDSFVQAIVATQDPGFWDHGGTDAGRMAGALADGVRQGRLRSGASTITEQLAKMTSGRTSARSISNRMGDALTARRIELSLTKQQIFEQYSARLPFGNGYTGLAAAAAGYFGKAPADLTLAESALLAALPDAPSRLNPYHHFADAKSRQMNVLNALAAAGRITADEARSASEAVITLRPPPAQTHD